MREAEKLFSEGMELYGNGYGGKALEKVRAAVELEKQNPLYVSYLGLLVALAQKKYTEAEQLCQLALRMKRNQVQSYLNLAEVYLKAGKKEDAVESLTAGLQYTKRDARLLWALQKLGVRRAPVFSFWKRTHFLNRQTGKLRHRLLGEVGGE